MNKEQLKTSFTVRFVLVVLAVAAGFYFIGYRNAAQDSVEIVRRAAAQCTDK